MTDQQLAQFIPLSQTRALLGESPCWSDVDQAIWWVDIIGHKLLRTALNGDTDQWETPEMPGFVQCLGGEIFVGMQTGIFQFDPTAASFEICVPMKTPEQRFNDACTDSKGRIWAGTMDIDNQRENGVLYLFDPAQRSLRPMKDGFRTINGLAWDDANNRLFFSDSHPSVQTVWTCELTPEDTLTKRQVFARFNSLEGRPDGATLDNIGHYWIAGVGGAALYRFTPDGGGVTQYVVPVKSPTKPIFIGAVEDVIVLTSFADDQDGGRLAIWRSPNIKEDARND